MKKILFLCLMLVLFSPAKSADKKILIAYYTMADIIPEGADAITHATPTVGNTRHAAQVIQNITKGDLFQIQTEKNYSASHQENSRIAQQELQENSRPKLISHVNNMEYYDIIFLGYPLWWYIEPMAIRSFLDEYNFTGKTIIPFCTSLGASVGRSENNIKELVPTATVLKGITLHTGRVNIDNQVSQWIDELDINN